MRAVATTVGPTFGTGLGVPMPYDDSRTGRELYSRKMHRHELQSKPLGGSFMSQDELRDYVLGVTPATVEYIRGAGAKTLTKTQRRAIAMREKRGLEGPSYVDQAWDAVTGVFGALKSKPTPAKIAPASRIAPAVTVIKIKAAPAVTVVAAPAAAEEVTKEVMVTPTVLNRLEKYTEKVLDNPLTQTVRAAVRDVRRNLLGPDEYELSSIQVRVVASKKDRKALEFTRVQSVDEAAEELILQLQPRNPDLAERLRLSLKMFNESQTTGAILKEKYKFFRLLDNDFSFSGVTTAIIQGIIEIGWKQVFLEYYKFWIPLMLGIAIPISFMTYLGMKIYFASRILNATKTLASGALRPRVGGAILAPKDYSDALADAFDTRNPDNEAALRSYVREDKMVQHIMDMNSTLLSHIRTVQGPALQKAAVIKDIVEEVVGQKFKMLEDDNEKIARRPTRTTPSRFLWDRDDDWE